MGEFGFLFTAIKLGAPSGLSSILLQSQAFFTALLAAVFLKERLRARQRRRPGPGRRAGLAFFGLGSGGSGGIGLPLLLMILARGPGLGGRQRRSRGRCPGSSSLGLLVWSSLFSPLPLAALSLAFEGPRAIAAAFSGLGLSR